MAVGNWCEAELSSGFRAAVTVEVDTDDRDGAHEAGRAVKHTANLSSTCVAGYRSPPHMPFTA